MVSGNINRHRPSPSKNKMTENQPTKQNTILFSLARRSEKGQSRPKLLYPDKYHKNKQTVDPPQPGKAGWGAYTSPLPCYNRAAHTPYHSDVREGPLGSWSPPSDNETSIPICQ